MTTNTSSIDQIIKDYNPFAGHIVVRPQQIWGKSYPDVPSINAHASNAVFDAIDKINKGQRQTVGITITAEKGLGKSHIISRIRHQLQTRQDSLFIYMSKYDNLNQIKYQFLQSVTSSLRAFIRPNVMPYQEIAAALINEVAQKQYTAEQYINNIFPNWLKEYSPKIVDKWRIYIEQKKPNITNYYIIQAILWTLSPNHVNAANYWLAGQELPEETAKMMGLPNIINIDKETQALNNVRQILDIISEYRVPVICFDELDIVDIADNGFTAAQIIANLAKDLYNNLEKCILLLAMYPETWRDQIRALPQAEAVIDRLVSEKSDRQPIELKYLNADDVVNLVRIWLNEFYQENQQIPPDPLYPFNENKLRELGKGKPTVRSILKWCAENFIPPIIDKPETETKIDSRNSETSTTTWTSTTIHAVKPYYQSELANVDSSIDSFMEDEISIINSLYLAFSSLVGKTLEGVSIQAVEEIVASTADQGYINFKIVGNKKKVKIGVSVVQQDGKFIGAALRRLIDYKKFDITRGCLVRSKYISQGATQARELLRKLLTEKGGEWVGLQEQDIKPLLAIWFVFENKDSYDLKDEQIFDFLEKTQLIVNNPLIREILSDPSGQEPNNLTDDGLPISIPQSVDNSDNIKFDF